MKDTTTTLIGKLARQIARLRGGGSALPGLIIEKINPGFLANKLSSLPHGVIVVSGTNGKTTTTKILTDLLQSQGLNVFTNKSGSNFVRGVLASLLSEVDWRGNLPADIAVIELDEAHAQHFISKVKPRYSLLLNIMRDQLDRFGEIDYTAKLLQQIGEATTETTLTNANDRLLSSQNFAKNIKNIQFFSFNPDLTIFFPKDVEAEPLEKSPRATKPIALLESFSNQQVELSLKGHKIKFQPKINGAHNLLNLTAACGMLAEVLAHEGLTLNQHNLINSLQRIQPAFGRGEIINFGQQKIEILLVKNPAGFRANLANCQFDNADIMIAINDNHADGRDMSWLWDVDFSDLKSAKIAAISGARAYEMALRLFHDRIDLNKEAIQPDLEIALNMLLTSPSKNKKIFTTYTAMLKIRELLSKITSIEEVL